MISIKTASELGEKKNLIVLVVERSFLSSEILSMKPFDCDFPRKISNLRWKKVSEFFGKFFSRVKKTKFQKTG